MKLRMAMKRFLIMISALLCAAASSACLDAKTDYASYVNPFVGTDEHGHTFPGAAFPFGMVQLSPDTRPMAGNWDGCSGYHYSDAYIYGFSHTHLSGTGCDDLCDVLLMPVRGYQGAIDKERYKSAFSHAQESAAPGYYSVYLADADVLAQMTVGERYGVHRYTYNSSADSPQLVIDLRHRDFLQDSRLVQVDEHTIEGYRVSRSWADHQHVHFHIRFNMPIATFEAQGNEAALISFKAPSAGKKAVLEAWVGISSVSDANARQNLEKEAKGSFEKVCKTALAAWNTYLGKIDVGGGTQEQLRNFYTALYHTAIHPSLYSDWNGDYLGMDRKVHNTAVGADGKARKPYRRYTVFSIWDTFRALHPLFCLIERERTEDFLRTFQSIYDECGKLPIWELCGHETNCMIGYNSVSVIADAYAKGIGLDGPDPIDYAKLLDAMVQSSRKHEFGLDSFYEDGAVLADKEHESVSKTLEYAYDAWCVVSLAKPLGRNDIAAEYERYAQNWRGVFDPSTGFMRPRLNGRWLTPFSPYEVNNHFTEANSWQYSFFVPQDVEGHIDALGGVDAYVAKLDDLFSASQQTTGRTQADITGLVGQYAHGNEPSHHIPYLYNFAGQPYKTQMRVRHILDNLYTSQPGGLCGNEDCGQMSAWYVMSAMGLYSVCPGKTDICLTSPLFDRVTVNLENGRRFVINSRNEGGIYIADARLNGQALVRSFISADDILKGGRLDFVLSSQPSADFGTAYVNRPHSRISNDALQPPVFVMENDVFQGVMRVEIAQIPDNGYVEYKLVCDGVNEDDQAFERYSGPFDISDNCRMIARAVVPRPDVAGGSLCSPLAVCHMHRVIPDRKLYIRSRYNRQYNAGGDEGLIDGYRGTTNWRTGGWQGYQDTDFEAVVDLMADKDISYLALGCCQDARSWIWMPKYVEFYLAPDGSNPDDTSSFVPLGRVENSVAEDDMTVQTLDFAIHPADTHQGPLKARYVKVFAKNIGTIPAWHPGAGGEGFIFTDEIIVR